MSPDARTAARVEAVGARTARRWIQLHLGRLPAPAARLARAVAVLERAQLPRAAALAELDLAEAAEAADTLVAAGILEPDRPLAFDKPLVRAGVYEELAIAERSLAHRRAAELMDGEPAGEEHAAEHLLATEPAGDRAIARRLVDAARTAARRGAPESAAVLLRRALAEPPPAAERPGLLLELGVAEATAGQAAGEAHLQEALDRRRRRPPAGGARGDARARARARARRAPGGRGRRHRPDRRAPARPRRADVRSAWETLAMMAGMLGADTAPPLALRLEAMRRRAGRPRRAARGAGRGRAARRRRRRAVHVGVALARQGLPRRGPRRCRSPPTCRGSAQASAALPWPTPQRKRRRARRRGGRRPRHRRLRALRNQHGVAGVDAAAPRRSAGRRRRRSHRARCRPDLPAPRLYRTIATAVLVGRAHRAGRSGRG